MMLRQSICVLALVAPIFCFGNAPDAIVGDWRFDSVRTLDAYLDQVHGDKPDPAAEKQIRDRKDDLNRNAAQNDQRLMASITRDTIRMTSGAGEAKTLRYEVISGDSRLVVADANTSDGNEFVIHIRVVEGGIAMETTHCGTQPETCASRRAGQGGADAQAQPRVRWIYFKPASA